MTSKQEPKVTRRAYHCDECGDAVIVERPDGDWSEPPCCTDCGFEMEPILDEEV